MLKREIMKVHRVDNLLSKRGSGTVLFLLILPQIFELFLVDDRDNPILPTEQSIIVDRKTSDSGNIILVHTLQTRSKSPNNICCFFDGK